MTPAAGWVEIDALVAALGQSMIRAQRRLDRRVEALARRFARGVGRQPLRVRAGDETIEVAFSGLLGPIGCQVGELRVVLCGALVTLETPAGARLGLRTGAAVDGDARRVMIVTLRPRPDDPERVDATLELDGVLLRTGPLSAPERPPPRPPSATRSASRRDAARERVYLLAPHDATTLASR